MELVINHDKSLQHRLQEYSQILSNVPASGIDREWSFYMELSADPIGWQAIWKIPRQTCEDLKISFPSLVLVFVVNINFEELIALVRVFAAQDDIEIAEKHYVPLVQLWPTKEQDKSVALNLETTANAMDNLRFFYQNLFMPWDKEDDDAGDWKSKHLETRLRLYYDMKNGSMTRATGEHVRALLSEARRLQLKREKAEDTLSDDEAFNVEAISANDNVKNLLEIHVRLMEIKGELEILENPLLRKAVELKHQESEVIKDNEQQNTWVIFNNAIADDYIKVLQELKTIYPNNILSFAPTLASKLEKGNINDIYLLGEGTHKISTTGALETGGFLKGIFSRDQTIITSNNDVMLDFIGQTCVIENLVIDANACQCAVLVRRGKTLLKNCKLLGNGESSTQQGIIVLAGAELEIIGCEITKFSTAIVGNSGAKITMKNCNVHDVFYGMKIYDKCSLNLETSIIKDCSHFGVVVETDDTVGEDKRIGSFETLKNIQDVVSESVTGENNGKGDVVISQKPKIVPVEDLFKNDDPTIIEYSDEEMEESSNDFLNNTVVEKPVSLKTC